jgi:glycosyl hydrolase family 113/carboxypeptidase family protein
MKRKTYNAVFASVCLLALVSMACTFSLFQIPTLPGTPTKVPNPAIPTATLLPKAQTVFMASLPEPLQAGESLGLAVLDEVTGLAFNPQIYPMKSVDGTNYTATLALPYNAVVRYHYVKISNTQAAEDTALDEPVRYRLYFVAGQAEVKDLVGGWGDRSYSRPLGSIEGRVLNVDTGAGIPDILVTAGGVRFFTDSAGRFNLEGLPVGTHNLVAYALDGTYSTFQQGATVAQGVSTAVEIKLKAAPLIHVTFNVIAPNDIQGVPVRIAGNLLELGNTFADLKGGVSTVADRMPVMALQPDGHYSISISLPAGAYVEYKYTLGDGFWNAEHKSTGEFNLREMIVPSQDTVIQDQVQTWQAGNSSPILFEVTVPSSTPAADLIYIQFNPYGWTEPLPMWPRGNNRWAYKLYGPINTLGNMRYRYCRNGQCGSADDASTQSDSAKGRAAETSLAGQDIQDTITNWAWLENTEPGTLVGSAITARGSGFVSGVEFLSSYQPNWAYYNPQAVQNVQALGANWIFFTPSWTYGRSSPLQFGLAPEHDPFWLDSAIMVSQARAANLNVGIFPIPHFATSAADFWTKAPRDAAWWQTWFDHYRAFAVNYADLAARTGSQALVLGGDWLSPALPGGKLPDGSTSGVPDDANARWNSVMTEVRQHFGGKIWMAVPYTPGQLQTSLDFLQAVDGIYLLWDAPLATQAGASKTDMANAAGALLDNEVAPLASVLGKPIILAVAYPSASGAATGCLSDGGGGCLDWTAVNEPNNPGSVSLDLQGQANIYEAMLNAINTRSWVAGFVSRGYYPPAMLQDKSVSVHGKPAADLLWYWLPRLTGAIK